MIEIRHETAGRSPVVFVDVGLETGVELDRLIRSVDGGGDVCLVVDLGDRPDVSSDVLALLHRTARNVRDVGGTLGVVSRSQSLRRLFELTLLSQAFSVFATRDEALARWT